MSTDEEYRALAERLAAEADRFIERFGWGEGGTGVRALREASAALPALLDANEEYDRRNAELVDRLLTERSRACEAEAREDDAKWQVEAVRAQRDEALAALDAEKESNGHYVAEATAREIALRAQLADATWQVRQAKGLARIWRSVDEDDQERMTYAEASAAILHVMSPAAALSVPAVPEEKDHA